MEIMNLKGTNDYSPKEQRIREYIEDTLKKVFKSFGYQALETPILCYYDLLALKYADDSEILNEIYKLTDQGDRELGLRYDLTVPFAKYITLNKGLTLPFKRYEIGKAFRDGPVKVGRNREFIQCDVDVVGIKSMAIEAELISLYQIAFKKLDIDIVIKYNNRKLLVGVLEELGINNNINEVISIIDKINKLTEEELINEFARYDLKRDMVKKILDCFNLSFNELKNKFSDTENYTLKDGINEVEELTNYLNNFSNKEDIIFNLSLARGQEYYTGTVFEVYTKDKKITSSIGGGGRYDKMITNFINDGNEYPAVGISFGLNVIYEVLKNREELTKSLIDLYIIPMNTQVESLLLANKLRDSNINVDIDMKGRKINKALDFANKNNIPYVIILGENELENRKIQLKDMFNSTSKDYDLDNLDSIISDILNKE